MDKLLKGVPELKYLAGGTVAAILVALTVGVLTGAIKGPQATALSTILLVVLTGGYAVATGRLVEETRSATKREFEPAPKLEFLPAGPRITNFGNGPAFDIVAYVSLDSKHYETIRAKQLAPGDSIRIDSEPFGRLLSDEKLRSGHDALHIEGDCKDIFKDEHDLGDVITMSKLDRLEVSKPDPQKRIQFELRQTRQEISQLRESVNKLDQPNQD